MAKIEEMKVQEKETEQKERTSTQIDKKEQPKAKLPPEEEKDMFLRRAKHFQSILKQQQSKRIRRSILPN